VGETSTAGADRPDAGRRSIGFVFTMLVGVPGACLVLLLGLAIALAVGSGLTSGGFFSRHHGFFAQHHRELVEFAVLGGAGLVVIVAAVAGMGLFARRISRELADLAQAAQRLADEQSSQLSEQASGQPHGGIPIGSAPEHGEPRDSAPRAAARDGGRPWRRRRITEVARAETAIARLRDSAVLAALSEANLRVGLRQVFVSMARRNQSLLQRQLRLIDALEQKAADPAALADLFSLDHLTTRMRRHAESLAILSGAAPGRVWRDPVLVIDVIRGAMAEVEDYRRVTILTTSQDAVAGPAAGDMIHLLAELIENATLFSPSGTPVEVRAARVANGFALEIDDRGLGIEPDQLAEINEQLASPPDVDLADADRLGLFVGAKLAVRHGVRVTLRASVFGGITAIVLLPNRIVVPEVTARLAPGTRPDGRLAVGRPARFDLRGSDGLALVGRRMPPASLRAADRRDAVSGHAARAGLPTRDRPLRGARAPGPAAAALAAPALADPAPAAPALADPAPADPASDAPAADAQDAPGGLGAPTALAPAAGGPATAGTYRGLPRRVRQASLSPHLRDSPPPEVRPAQANLRPSPDQARDLAASLQSGWQRSRDSAGPDAPDPSPEAGEQAAGQQDTQASQSEDG
jgi:signal transduction histidine kinase